MRLAKKAVAWMLTAAFAVLLLVGSVANVRMPSGLTPPVRGADKAIHGLAYGVLAALLCRALTVGSSPGRWRFLIGALLAVAYGAAVEIAQAATGARVPSAWDVAANTVGACVGAFCWWAAVKRASVRRGGAAGVPAYPGGLGRHEGENAVRNDTS